MVILSPYLPEAAPDKPKPTCPVTTVLLRMTRLLDDRILMPAEVAKSGTAGSTERTRLPLMTILEPLLMRMPLA